MALIYSRTSTEEECKTMLLGIDGDVRLTKSRRERRWRRRRGRRRRWRRGRGGGEGLEGEERGIGEREGGRGVRRRGGGETGAKI